MIELQTHLDGDTVVTPTGNLDWIDATALRHLVDVLLRMRMNFVIDLSRTYRADASGLSALVGTMRRARSVGVRVCIVNPRPFLRRQLALIGVDQLNLCSKTANSNDGGHLGPSAA
jgi:anti-anti-sigma factor